MNLAARFLAAFEGSDVAHGQTTVGRTQRNGKAEAKSFVVREPLTKERVASHLSGKQGIGQVPINTHNRVKFGAIDIDDYDLDLQDVVKRVKDQGLPLIVCRSKSGGAHLYMFLSQFEEAMLVREYLTEISSALGYAGREIFPKQDTIMVDRGVVGNFINLPYFNAEQTMRYALDENGEALSVEGFLDLVEAKRCNLADLERVMLHKQEHAEELKDYPPCIRRIIANGGFDVNRNICLFHSCVAIKKDRPDDWKEGVEEWNYRYVKPPLPASEVATIQSQHSKKEYGFSCDQSPLKDYCDKDLCRQAKHGIGGKATSFPTLTGLTIMRSDPRVYYLNVDGKRLELNIEQLNSPREFQKKCLQDLNFRPDIIKDQEWGALVNKLMADAIEIEVPPELTTEGQFFELLEEFCTSRIRAMSPEEVHMGKPWTDKGFTNFKTSGLMAFLKKREFTAYTRAQVQERIKKLNPETYDGKLNIRKEDGSRVQVRVLRVPEFKTSQVDMSLEDDDVQEVPF